MFEAYDDMSTTLMGKHGPRQSITRDRIGFSELECTCFELLQGRSQNPHGRPSDSSPLVLPEGLVPLDLAQRGDGHVHAAVWAAAVHDVEPLRVQQGEGAHRVDGVVQRLQAGRQQKEGGGECAVWMEQRESG